MNPVLSIVIPAYNEEKRVRRSLLDVQSFLKVLPQNVEVILVVEKSSDNTVKIAEEIVGGDPKFKIIANKVQHGKGFAVQTGMLAATGDLQFFMDLDLSTPLAEIFNFLGHFEAHPETDVLIGSRQHKESEIIKKQHPIRQNMGHTFNFFVQLLAFKGITDTQCGFKAFRKIPAKEIFTRQKTRGFSFDVEVLMLAQAMGYKIDVLPVKWVNAPDSKVRIIRDSIHMLIDLLKIRAIVKKTMRRHPLTKS